VKQISIVSLALCLEFGALASGAAAQSGPVNPGPAVSPSTAAHPPGLFTLRYTPGETMRYQVSFRSQSKSLVGGAVENPQGATELGLAVGLTLRLEVLSPIPVAAGGSPSAAPARPAGSEGPPLRLRASYEGVSATLSGDSYDPSATKLLAQYRSLEGRSIEFQLGPRGDLEYVEGLDETLQDPRAFDAVRAWLEQLGTGLGAPATGAAPGQSWERTQPVSDAPLTGTSVQTTSTYLRDEACSAEDPAGEQCAVVLMRFSLGQKPGEKSGTPEAFRRNHLRTSGQWTSKGESLVRVSLLTGRTVSVSQSSEELMDINIRHEDGGVPFRYAGRTRTETHLLLLGTASANP